MAPRSLYVSLTGHLPDVQVYDLPMLANADSIVRSQFERCKRNVKNSFEAVRLQVFSCHGQDINSDGEVVFILRKAYCQSLIQWAMLLVKHPLVKNKTHKAEMMTAVCNAGLLDAYHKYQKRLFMSFQMITLKPDVSVDVNLATKVLHQSYLHACEQWLTEAGELCKLSDSMAIRHVTNVDQFTNQFDNAMDEFMNLDSINLKNIMPALPIDNSFNNQVKMIANSISLTKD